jgi:hypothetical protein
MSRINTFDDFLAFFPDKPRAKAGRGWLVICPAHTDHTPSLWVRPSHNPDFVATWDCKAGSCKREDVLKALNLTWADVGKNAKGPFVKSVTKPKSTGQTTNTQTATTQAVSIQTIECVYHYDGFEVVRLNPKGFYQRRPDGNGGYINDIKGITTSLYHQDELPPAISAGKTIYIVEGEKDVDRLRLEGFVATCNPMGAGKWLDSYSQALQGGDLVIIPDNDGPGRDHKVKVSCSCYGKAARIRILELPLDTKDVSEWLDKGHTAAELTQLASRCQNYPPSASDLLQDVAAFIKRYVILTYDQVLATAVWVLHTYAFEAADATPYLSISSPEKRSGKTRLLETLELVVARPWFTGRVTPAVLARKINEECPTLLLDESDAAFKGEKEYAEALRGILNTGYRRGGKTSLCFGSGGAITYGDLSTFCPKAIAGIGKLPDTIADRSIPIILKRRTSTEVIERFQRRKAEKIAQLLRQRLDQWATVATGKLKDAEPNIPGEIDDRAGDCWEPLLGIGDMAGGDWPQKVREAAIALMTGEAREENSLGIRLLNNINTVFSDEQMSSKALVAALIELEDAPWADLDARHLARLLKPYGIRPGNLRIGKEGHPDVVLKGYKKTDFADAFSRYIPEINSQPPTGTLPATSATQARSSLGGLSATKPQIMPDVADNSQARPEASVAPVADNKGVQSDLNNNQFQITINILGLPAFCVIAFWRSEGAPIVYLEHRRTYCEDLAAELNEPDTATLKDIKKWLDEKHVQPTYIGIPNSGEIKP